MIKPAIDKLIKKTDCRYALVCGITKRTKELLALETDELERSGMKAITYAAYEVESGKIKITKG